MKVSEGRGDVVVVGAGVAGLAGAALLAQDGYRVQVLERRDAVGGRSGSLAADGFRFDTGPSWYLMPQVFEHFFRLLGTTAEAELNLTHLDPAYRVFVEPTAGRPAPPPITVPRGRDRVLDLFEDLEPGSARALDAYLESARAAADLATRHFLYNPFADLRTLLSAEVRKSGPALVRTLSTPLDAYIARRFRHPALRQILGYPAVFLGTHPGAAPAFYHLMSAFDLDDGVRYPMGGFWELSTALQRLAERKGVTITTGADVQRITTSRGVATGVLWRDPAGRKHHTEADHVVSAADLHHTETELLADEADRTYPEKWWRRRTSGPGAVLAMLGVEGNLPALAHHSLFFTRDWRTNFEAIFGRPGRVPDPASLYVSRPSATDPTVAPPGFENLFLLVPVPADPGLGSGGAHGRGSPVIEGVVDRAIAQIGAWANVPGLAERVVVRHSVGPGDFARDFHSWRGGALGPAHVLRQSAMFRAGNTSRKVARLYYAGATAAPGIGLPMCLISAELVLKHIRGDRSAGPVPEPQTVGVDG